MPGSASPADRDRPLAPRLRRGPSLAKAVDGALAVGALGDSASAPRLRRGPSLKAVPDPAAFDTPPFPRLRRGSSFAAPSATSTTSALAAASVGPHGLRPIPGGPRGLERTKSVDGVVGSSDGPPPPATYLRRSAAARHSTTGLPRAGTYAYGLQMPTTRPVPERVVSTNVRRASSGEKLGRAKRSCGMCGNCNGVGLKGMPPWAPERLKLLTPEEREAVLSELRAKEEVGKLEAEIRQKRVDDMRAVGRRLEKRRTRAELMSEGTESDSTTDTRKAEKTNVTRDEEEMESVDLGDEENERVKGQRRRRTRPVALGLNDLSEDGRDVFMEHEEKSLDDDCGLCDGLETKVGDLEEQLAMLKEVVKLCADNEEAARKLDGENEKSKKGKTWMDKIASAYYGNATATAERNRLKEEVDVLKKASDFLFEKLQTTGTSSK